MFIQCLHLDLLVLLLAPAPPPPEDDPCEDYEQEDAGHGDPTRAAPRPGDTPALHPLHGLDVLSGKIEGSR